MRTGGDVAWAAGRWRVAPAFRLALAFRCTTSGPIASRDRGPEMRVLLGAGLESVPVDERSVRDEKRFRRPGPHEVDGRRVRGAVEVSRGADGLRVVNELPLEDSVAGSALRDVTASCGAARLRARAPASQPAGRTRILARFDSGAHGERATRAAWTAPVEVAT
jgi:hypothetical protein